MTAVTARLFARLRPPAGSPVRVRSAGRAVLGVWAALTLVSVWFLWHYRGTVPTGDEWWDVPAAIGSRSLTWDYLWSAANDHRFPLPRLVYAATVRATGGEFRAISVLNGVLLSAAAGAVLLALRARRGGESRLSDVAVPLLLTNLGMWEPLLWNAVLNHVLASALAVLLLVVLSRPGEPTDRRVAVAGLLGLGMIGSGGTGVAYIPGLILWLAWVAVAHRRWTAAVAGAVLAAALVTYFTPDGSPTPRPVRGVPAEQVVRVALQFAAVGLGPVAFRWTPLDPGRWPLLGAAVAGLAVMTAVAVMRNRGRLGGQWAGLLAFAVGVAALAVGLGTARGDDSPTPGYGPRYTTLAAPGLCGIYLAATAVGGRFGRGVTLPLAVAAVVVWGPSFIAARPGAADQKRWLGVMADDVARGMPADFVADRYAAVAGGYADYLADRMADLRAAGVRPFDRLVPARPLAGTPLPVAPVPDDGGIVLPLGEPRAVTGVRVTYTLRGPVRAARVLVGWRAEPDAPFAGRTTAWHSLVAGDRRTTLVWIDDALRDLRLPVPAGCELTVHAVEAVR
jgi:hypothetical protein